MRRSRAGVRQSRFWACYQEKKWCRGLCSGPEPSLSVCRHPHPDRRRGRHKVGARQLLCPVHARASHKPCPLGDTEDLCLHAMQESVKTKHPQLLYESKLYKILQGGSESPSPKSCLGRILPSICPTDCSRSWFACSWDPERAVVWRGRRLQCHGSGLAGSELGGPLQLLQPQVQSQDCAHASRPAGERSCLAQRLHPSTI